MPLPIPDPDEPDAKARATIACLLLLIAVAAAVAASLGDVPRPVPAWALKNAVVWRVEVFVALVFLPYAILSLVVLALYGRVMATFNTPFGGGDSSKVTAPDPEQTGAVDEVRAATAEVRGIVVDGLADVGSRVRRIEDKLGLADEPDG